MEYDDHILALLLLEHEGGFDFGTSLHFNGLRCTSFFGIVKVVATLVEMKCYDLNGGNCWGCTPLSWAAEKGHEEVVNILLGREEVNLIGQMIGAGHHPRMLLPFDRRV